MQRSCQSSQYKWDLHSASVSSHASQTGQKVGDECHAVSRLQGVQHAMQLAGHMPCRPQRSKHIKQACHGTHVLVQTNMHGVQKVQAKHALLPPKTDSLCHAAGCSTACRQHQSCTGMCCGLWGLVRPPCLAFASASSKTVLADESLLGTLAPLRCMSVSALCRALSVASAVSSMLSSLSVDTLDQSVLHDSIMPQVC